MSLVELKKWCYKHFFLKSLTQKTLWKLQLKKRLKKRIKHLVRARRRRKKKMFKSKHFAYLARHWIYGHRATKALAGACPFINSWTTAQARKVSTASNPVYFFLTQKPTHSAEYLELTTEKLTNM